MSATSPGTMRACSGSARVPGTSSPTIRPPGNSRPGSIQGHRHNTSATNAIRTIYQDRAGSLWFGSSTTDSTTMTRRPRPHELPPSAGRSGQPQPQPRHLPAPGQRRGLLGRHLQRPEPARLRRRLDGGRLRGPIGRPDHQVSPRSGRPPVHQQRLRPVHPRGRERGPVVRDDAGPVPPAPRRPGRPRCSPATS